MSMLITDPLAEYAQRCPQKTCIVSSQGSLTYGQLARLIEQIACSLQRYRRQRTPVDQPRVALLLGNRVELLQVFLAAARIGWLTLVLDPKWTAREVMTTLLEAGPDVVLVEQTYAGQLQALPDAPHVVLLPTSDQPLAEGSYQPFAEWIGESLATTLDARASDEELFYVGFTSGTTGKPKGFMRDHRSWIASFYMSNAAFGIDAQHHVLAPGPLVHSLSIYAACATLFAGATFYLLPRFEAARVLALLATAPVSHLYLVPTMFEALVRERAVGEYTDAHFQVRSIISTGDKWSASSKQKIGELFPGTRLYEFYGASELSFVTILDPEGNRCKPESVGKAASGVQISLRDTTGQEVCSGEIGQLYVQSAMLFAGYYHLPEETRGVLHDGWATVGDLAWLDEEGFLYLAGRKQNMLISGGLNIYPEEIESVLLRLSSLAEAMVMGLPDPYWGERVIALLLPKAGNQVQPEELATFCKTHLPAYKCPKAFLQVKAFPHTPSGKIARDNVIRGVISGDFDLWNRQ